MGYKYRSRPGISWGAMRKVLERENICDSLRGRVQYFQTRYREAHDQIGRIAIRVDGKEVIKANYFDPHDDIKNAVCSPSFYGAFYEYLGSSIENSLKSPDPLVRLFAILDKRVGKRRLDKLLPEVEKQPEWLQLFYRLRLGAENVSSKQHA